MVGDPGVTPIFYQLAKNNKKLSVGTSYRDSP